MLFLNFVLFRSVFIIFFSANTDTESESGALEDEGQVQQSSSGNSSSSNHVTSNGVRERRARANVMKHAPLLI